MNRFCSAAIVMYFRKKGPGEDGVWTTSIAPILATIVLGAVTPQEVARNLDLVARPVPATLWRDLKTEGLLAEAAPVPET